MSLADLNRRPITAHEEDARLPQADGSGNRAASHVLKERAIT